MNDTRFKSCLIFLAFCLAASLTAFFLTDLKEPVFLEHYYERMIGDEQCLELSYITNHYGDARVDQVTFPRLEGSGAFVSGWVFRRQNAGHRMQYTPYFDGADFYEFLKRREVK